MGGRPRLKRQRRLRLSPRPRSATRPGAPSERATKSPRSTAAAPTSGAIPSPPVSPWVTRFRPVTTRACHPPPSFAGIGCAPSRTATPMPDREGRAIVRTLRRSPRGCRGTYLRHHRRGGRFGGEVRPVASLGRPAHRLRTPSRIASGDQCRLDGPHLGTRHHADRALPARIGMVDASDLVAVIGPAILVRRARHPRTRIIAVPAVRAAVDFPHAEARTRPELVARRARCRGAIGHTRAMPR